jgi:cyclophilin family peptidyl-prolyl cis-trans isomerase
LSPDQNRPRPRSSKKQRARQGSAARAATQRPRTGPTRGGPASSGLSTTWLVVIGIAVFALGAALAGGAIQFGGGTAQPSSAISGRLSFAPGASPSGRVLTGCPTSQPPAAPAGEKRIVTIETAKGQIQITLDASLSPIAVGNFAALAGCGYYDGIVFHRIATLQDGTPFVIQGGDPDGTGTGGPGYEIQDEPVTAAYVRGTVAMARTAAPNSVGSQFFIVLDDKDQSVLASANTYQIIGSVTSGMETVDAIYAAAKGVEIPPDPIAMTKVTIGPPLGASPSAPASPSAKPS